MENPNHPTIPKILNVPKSPKNPNLISRPGYEYLAAYQLALMNQLFTEQFTFKWIESKRRKQQMDEAARSTAQNVAEGYTQASLKGYIYLTGIARGSNVELGKDYQTFLIQNDYAIWPTTHTKIRVFRGFRVKWISQNSPACAGRLNTPNLPIDPQEAANMLLTFSRMEGYLLTRLIESLLEKHKTEGGLTEKLYMERKSYRGY